MRSPSTSFASLGKRPRDPYKWGPDKTRFELVGFSKLVRSKIDLTVSMWSGYTTSVFTEGHHSAFMSIRHDETCFRMVFWRGSARSWSSREGHALLNQNSFRSIFRSSSIRGSTRSHPSFSRLPSRNSQQYDKCHVKGKCRQTNKPRHV
jgi:hypothetical protein